MPSTTYGWCAAHPGNDHELRPTCAGFVSDAKHTARLLADAAEHDRRAGSGGVEARYVAEHRPY